MENKQTAVEWLEDSFRINFNKIFVDTDFGLVSHLFKQAEEMEKDQIKIAYAEGVTRVIHKKTLLCEEYYDKTYGK